MNKRKSLILGAILLLVSGAVFAHDTLKQRVSWSPATINLSSLKPGESLVVNAVLTNASFLKNQKINGEHLTFKITNPDGATISATADFPKKLEPGKSVSVRLAISVASSTPALPPRVIAGTVQLVKKEGDDEKEKNEVKIFEKSLPVNIAVSSIPLPPFPNKEEDAATIEGVDFNGNGVPDRVEWFIAKTVPDSEKKRAAMTLSAKAQQDFFKDFLAHLGEDPNDALVIARVRALADIGSKTYNCQRYVFGATTLDTQGDEGMTTVGKNIRETDALYMDTPERLRAFRESERPLEATSAPNVQPEQYKQQCLDLGLDPDSLPN